MFNCKMAGQAKSCNSCVNNPLNQKTDSWHPKISPTITKGECKHFVGIIQPIRGK